MPPVVSVSEAAHSALAPSDEDTELLALCGAQLWRLLVVTFGLPLFVHTTRGNYDSPIAATRHRISLPLRIAWRAPP